MSEKKVLQDPTLIELEGIKNVLRENLDVERILEGAKLNLLENLELLEVSDASDSKSQADLDLIEDSIDVIMDLEGLSDNLSDSTIDLKKVAADGLRFYKETEKKESRRKFVRSFMLKASAVILVLSFSLAITDNVFGFNFFEAFVNWSKAQIGLDQTSVVYDGRTTYLDSVDKIHKITGINVSTPKYLPSGYELDTIKIDGTETAIRITIRYLNENEYIRLLVSDYKDIVVYDFKSEKNDPDAIEYVHNGISHSLKINFDVSSASWQSKNQVYSISGAISEEEMKKIIDSMY